MKKKRSIFAEALNLNKTSSVRLANEELTNTDGSTAETEEEEETQED